MLFQRLKLVAFLAAAWCWTSEAQFYYDVACPGVFGQLKCPEGHGIVLVSMNYGVKSDADCDARDKPALVSDKNCIHPGMLGWAQERCDAKEECVLPRPNERMFLCDYSPDTFLQFTYRCQKVTDVSTTVICEGESGTIRCENGLIHVVNSNFGRNDENTCTDTPSKHIFCTSVAAEYTVKALCQNEEECTLTATAALLGEPSHCDDKPLYLSVDYICH